MINNAKWITAGTDFKQSLPSFRKSWQAKGSIVKATAQITAFGVYDFYIDGQKVGDYFMAPGWTYYAKRLQYQQYDITKLLGQSNELSITLAPGWACGFIGWNRYKADYTPKTPALIAAVEITYADGTRECLYTDESWNVFSSQVLFSELYDGETVDYTAAARFIKKAQVIQSPVPNIVPQTGPRVVEQETVFPAAILKTPKNETVIDFGQNLTGYVQIRCKGSFGDRVRLSYAEVLDRDGNFYNANYRTSKNDVLYILDEKERILKPNFTFQGFRYVRLDEFPGEPELEAFCAKAVYSDIRRTGTFSCGHEKLNRLYSNILWGQRSNYLDIPTDCPQRDERLGWTGDAQVFCRTAALNFDVEQFFRKWLQDMALNQGPKGEIYGVIPTFHYTGKVSAAWGDAATVCPWELYRAYANKEDLRASYEMMKKWVQYMHDFGEDEFLYIGGLHYGDWLAMDAGEDLYMGATQTDLIASAYFAYSTELTIKAGKVLGEDTAQLEELYRNIRRAFREAFMENGLPRIYHKGDALPENRTGLFSRPLKPVTQTAIALILRFGLYEPEERQKLVDTLVELIRDFGGRMSTGFVGTPHLLHVLSDHGRADIAFDLLLQEKNPSWLFSVNQGATTMWEHWDSKKEDGSFWSTDMNSFNHYAYGSVYDWMFGDMIGVTVCNEGPGYEKITYCPHPDPRIGFAEASLQTVRGMLRAGWWYLPDGSVRYELTLPKDTTAQIQITGLPVKTVTGGKYIFTVSAPIHSDTLL